MLSPCPPWWEQCHHPAGNPKAGKHQQGALLWHIGAAVWHSWAPSLDNIDPDSHDLGSVYRGKQDRGFVALCCSAGQRGTALQNNHWKGSVPHPIKRRKNPTRIPSNLRLEPIESENLLDTTKPTVSFKISWQKSSPPDNMMSLYLCWWSAIATHRYNVPDADRRLIEERWSWHSWHTHRFLTLGEGPVCFQQQKSSLADNIYLFLCVYISYNWQ